MTADELLEKGEPIDINTALAIVSAADFCIGQICKRTAELDEAGEDLTKQYCIYNIGMIAGICTLGDLAEQLAENKDNWRAYPDAVDTLKAYEKTISIISKKGGPMEALGTARKISAEQLRQMKARGWK